jgi:hypothetical protein
VIAHTVTPFNRAGDTGDASTAGGNGDGTAVADVDVDIDADHDGNNNDGANKNATHSKPSIPSQNVTPFFLAYYISISYSLDLMFCSHVMTFPIQDTTHVSAHSFSTTAHIRTGRQTKRAGRVTCV